MKKIYISTPINARREKTFQEKRDAAFRRCNRLKCIIENEWENVQAITPFMVIGVHDDVSEAEAIGRCITALLQCDAIYLDHGWNGSKGCTLEYYAAKRYGIEVIEHDKV